MAETTKPTVKDFIALHRANAQKRSQDLKTNLGEYPGTNDLFKELTKLPPVGENDQEFSDRVKTLSAFEGMLINTLTIVSDLVHEFQTLQTAYHNPKGLGNQVSENDPTKD